MRLNFYQAAEPTTTLVFNAAGIVGGNAPRIGARDTFSTRPATHRVSSALTEFHF
jgi:hypothetical protein